jgi:hypothetical protein
MAMTSLDRVFQIIFARYRRELGDGRIEFAWRRTCNDVWWSLAWPTAAVTFILVVLTCVATGAGTLSDHRRYELISGAISFLIVSSLLKQRFKKFLLSAPQVPEVESPSDRRYVFWFRAILRGGAVLVGAMIYAAHEAGAHFMQGF